MSDELHADWCLWGAAHVPFAPIAARAGCASATLGAPTKTFNLAGLHSSYVLFLDDARRERYLAVVSHAFLHFGSTFATVASIAAYTHGHEWLRAAKAYVQANLLWLAEQLASTPLRVHVPEATYLVWIDFSSVGLPDAAALEAFVQRDARVLLSPGREFGAETAQFQRLNAACPRSVLVEAVGRLKRALKARRGL